MLQAGSVAKRRRRQQEDSAGNETDDNDAVKLTYANAHEEKHAGSVCNYVETFHEGRNTPAEFYVRSKSKNAQPKWRHLCVDCCHWMHREGLLAEIQELVEEC